VLHNEELHGLYSSSSIISMTKSRKMDLAVTVARTGDVKQVQNFTRKPEGNRLLDRSRIRWGNNVKVDL